MYVITFLFMEVRAESYKDCSPTDPDSRSNIVLHRPMNSWSELWGFVKKLLILPHGHATVEHGFSVNKKVETWKIDEDTCCPETYL